MRRVIVAAIYFSIKQLKVYRLDYGDQIISMDRFHRQLPGPSAYPETTGSVAFREILLYLAATLTFTRARSLPA